MNFSGKEHNMKKSFRILLILAAAVVLFVSGCACADITEGLIYDETDNTWAAVDEDLTELVGIMKRECAKSPMIKGTYILAADDRIIFIGGINSEDIYGNKVDAYTTYEIGSLTKAFTATAVFQLCERWKLSLDSTLGQFFPDFEYGKDITVYHLLHMQSGLRKDFVSGETFLDENGNPNTEEFRRYYYDGFTDEELLSMLFSDEPEFTPGTRYAYSNTGYTLLAMIIEKITGKSYEEYVQENIFDVCGMEHSSSMTTGDVTSIPEYVPDDSSPFNDPYEIVDTLYMQLIKPERGVGDIHSCAADLLLFDRALIEGKLINEDSLAEMFHIDKGYGCGWVQAGRYANTYYHGGETYIYKAYNLYAKSQKYGNIYLIQLHPTVAGDQYSNECMLEIIRAVMK
jgi:CubicO group peptidase (beta-lactamase class C family)